MNSRLSLRELFDSLADLDEEERRRRLSELALTEPDSNRLSALLAADSAPSPLLPESVERLIERMGQAEDLATQLIGTQVGSFRLIEAIGEGASALVFRAERPVGDGAQLAALKLIYGGSYSSGLRRRSLREQSILAQLSHPNIARLIEAGVTEVGIPYIAMEFVDGLPITQHAEHVRMDLRQRVDLVADLCAAIDAAHAALIVHCDLKPSNVFVARDGTLKVLDFGVARLLGAGQAGATRTVAFTPEYAAPEQFRPGAPTVAVDIYAIGILFGELLTGARMPAGDHRTASARVLAQDAPEPPAGMPSRAALSRALSGDIDAILARCTAEDPAERYRSVGALRSDLCSYLEGRPVAARTWTRRYRIRKFIQRNRRSVLSSALLLLGLLSSLFYALWQAELARDHASAALAEARRADAMRDAAFEIFAEADPATPRDGDVTVVEAVEHAIDRLMTDTQMDARSRLELLDHSAVTIGRHGKVPRALQVLESAFAQSVAALGETDVLTLRIGTNLANHLALNGDYAPARVLVDRLLPLAPTDALELRVRLTMRSALLAWRQRDPGRAYREGHAAVALSRTGTDTVLQRKMLSDLGVVMLGIGRIDDAIRVFEEVLQLSEAQFGSRHEKVALASSALARAYRRSGDLERSEAFARRALEIDRAIYAGDHYITANHLNALAMVQQARGDLRGSLDSELERLRIVKATMAEDSLDMRGAIGSVGAKFMLLERFAEAEPYLRDALSRESTAAGPASAVTALYRANFGYTLGMLGNRETGSAELERAIADLNALDPSEPWILASALEKRIRLALNHAEPEQALDWIAPLAQAIAQVPPPEDRWLTGRAGTLEGAVLLAAGRIDEAALALSKAEIELAARPGADPITPVEHLLLQAKVERLSGRDAQARQRASQAREALQRLPEPPPHLLRLANELTE